ncbi:MAG TPA: ATP-binding protein, partial [Candidatus Polarisedimenticolia bacterium]|nr:ATP-binding protein [Candidatus Polarisedimenticolia bacterium]
LATACLGIAVPLALRARVWIRRPIARLLEALGRTHYRKVLTAFTATTMVPLLALSVILTRYITAQIEEEVEARGRSSIESAGILLRTHLRQDDAGLADDTFFYLSRLLGGADLNLYQDGALLYTSRRELFSSGLIPPRIDGGVFRELVIDGRRFAIGHQRLKGFDYLTVSAPVIAGEPGSVGLISVPLDAQAAEAEARAREVGDVILITFVAMILLMGGVGYVLAVRVSRPIRSLSSSAARIAAGDFDARVAARPRDETGELIRSFNEMARALKEQREDLERRRDYIEKILLNATIGVISLDRAGFVVTVNPAAGTILDLPGIVPGASLLDLLTRRPDLAALDRLLREGAAHAPRDVEMTLPEGPPDRAVRARAVTFLEGAGVILLLEDVTETIRSNRLAAWAEMARRIAHEIKNPLTPIQLSAEHILRVYDEKSPSFPAVLAECLRTIMQEVANLRQISAEFSTYARIPTPRREPTAMSSLLEDIMRPYRSAAPPGITLQLRVPAGLPTLDVDRSLIGRAIVNLVENALQAMPRGGALRVSARSGPDGLLIDVEDTGIGMDESARSRIFEPYFSTKDTGTGLGLAIARKAVEEHGGRIEVVSAPGEGTTMRIVLPLAREEAAREPTHPVGGSG